MLGWARRVSALIGGLAFSFSEPFCVFLHVNCRRLIKASCHSRHAAVGALRRLQCPFSLNRVKLLGIAILLSIIIGIVFAG